jgi:PAS domain-containing protein
MGKPASIEVDKDLLLSHFTLENLHEAVYWIDSSGNILMVNQKACDISGFEKGELTGMSVFELSPEVNEKNYGKKKNIPSAHSISTKRDLCMMWSLPTTTYPLMKRNTCAAW